MNVPYFDLKAQYRDIRDELLAALDRVCENASFILGSEVAELEWIPLGTAKTRIRSALLKLRQTMEAEHEL